ncbi:hypothetical protein RhiirA5_451341 [Rhizophagus irregularis]|uniref:Uncharacterized protein n=2 Tax=Rhizophagus irregularis TaxID=588596 RepID=A0A2N0P9C7_9GLOM|nr:hypothetical protein GLOIN_2v1719386 [Rhizophagus irregularis DAOM 181602=DAOM 197198]PKC03449.1 hypothetical protein RhiirA5_451341 [Rhizophagus irregularis]PKC58739.1 hypothetical protein RhiirA1_470526 [Rhizophagus irregularis]PKC59316.1 hypothetical protein RhiirA1_493212 [Rhizophagus irregularis]POG59798.1 hypothetical protein GLOIN_2v1719386 [Rhizophagus irregularis DAOM 181602=DAOM 197198]CAB4474279.1 unnamed protein product [Rhizophagus irregularis]|eukprot:XP_025166664.1 hypothetical protein GLOIN_2v1719386 [Rhizophagus irregularis DAOM 181602=DAOM 197198]
MADSTEYTSESDILDSFVYNLLPIFLFTMNFLDDNWNYNSSTGGRIFDDAIFLGTPFIGTLILMWIKNVNIIWLNIFYTIHVSFVLFFFVATRVWLNHGELNHEKLNHEELNHEELNHGELNHEKLNHEGDVKYSMKYVYEKITWKVWIHRILFSLIISQTILIIFSLIFMYKFLPEESLTKADYKYYLWEFFPCMVIIFYLIIQSLIFYRKEDEKEDKKNKKNEENERKNKKLIETITRFIIWSILHGIIVTELWLFPINAYFTKFYLLLYVNCVTLIFRYDSPKGIKFGVGFLNFIFIENSNSLKENFHLSVKYFFFLDEDEITEHKDPVHNDRFRNIRSLYTK